MPLTFDPLASSSGGPTEMGLVLGWWPIWATGKGSLVAPCPDRIDFIFEIGDMFERNIGRKKEGLGNEANRGMVPIVWCPCRARFPLHPDTRRLHDCEGDLWPCTRFEWR